MRDAAPQQFQRLAVHRQEVAHLRTAAAGHQYDDARLRRQDMARSEFSGVAPVCARFKHWMADKAGGEPVPGEESRLKRQETEQPIPAAAEVPHASFPPSPDLRSNVVGTANPERLDRLEKAEHKIRAVDGHD